MLAGLIYACMTFWKPKNSHTGNVVFIRVHSVMVY